jgi:hypothetical protein
MQRPIVCIFPVKKNHDKEKISAISDFLCKYFDVITYIQRTNYDTCKQFGVLLAIIDDDDDDDEYRQEVKRNQFTSYIRVGCDVSVKYIIDKIAECAKPYSGLDQTASNVIVFDFDDTLVSPDLQLFYQSLPADLELYRNLFDYVVLWTHGTQDYIYDSLNMKKFKFDLVMSRFRNCSDTSVNKGLAAVLRQLNTKCGVNRLNFCVLVDDKPSNQIGEYDVFVEINNEPCESFYKKLLHNLSDARESPLKQIRSSEIINK